MPDEAPPTLQTVENGDIPAPLSNLMRFVSIQVKKLQTEEATQRLHNEVKRRLQDILLDFGFGEEIVESIGDEFGGEVIQLSQEAIPRIETSIRLAYEKCLGETSQNEADKNVILKKVGSRSDLRLVFNALRTSTDFRNLRENRIWMLPGLKLKNILENTFCRNGSHWYKMILMALRFCEEEKTLSSYDISADGLRHFLCDYVFCVPREEFIGKPHTGRRPRVVRTLPLVTDKKPKSVDALPGDPQPKSEYRAYLTKKQRALADFIYCFDGEKFDPIKRRKVSEYVVHAGVGSAAVYMLLGKVKEVLFSESIPVVSKWGKDIPESDETISTDNEESLTPDIPATVIVSEMLLPKKASLAGVVIPDELPDVSQLGNLPKTMREIFLLYYGYTAGDTSNPASYDVLKRMTREEIAAKRQINKISVYQTLQKTMLRLRPSAVGEIKTTEHPSVESSVTIDDKKIVLEMVPETVPIKKSTTPLPEKIRPTHSNIPPTIGSYGELVRWLQEEGQVSLVRALKNQLMHAQGKKGEGLPSLGVRIFGGFTFGSLEARVLQLVHFFDSKKDFVSFIGELKAHKSAEKPPQPKKHPIPTFTPRPVAPPHPVRAAEEKQPEPAKPKEIILFGLTVPEFTRYEDFIAWASKEEKIVTPLITFYTGFRASAGSQSVKPGSLDLVKLGKDSDGWKTLLYGTQLRKIADMGQVLLDICDIKPEPVPVVATPPKTTTTAPKKAPPQIPVVQKSLEDQMLDLMIEAQENKAGMRYVGPIANAYMSGEYERAGSAYEQFRAAEWRDDEPDDSESNTVVSFYNTLFELHKKRHEANQPVSIFGLILELGGHEFEEDPLFDYKIEHYWEERLGEMLTDSGVTSEQVKAWCEQQIMSDLFGELRQVQLHIPLGHTKWLQWQEKSSLETNLAQFMESLIAHDHLGEKRWNGQIDIKELKKKLRHIKFPSTDEE